MWHQRLRVRRLLGAAGVTTIDTTTRCPHCNAPLPDQYITSAAARICGRRGKRKLTADQARAMQRRSVEARAARSAAVAVGVLGTVLRAGRVRGAEATGNCRKIVVDSKALL